MGKESQGKIVELQKALERMKTMEADDAFFFMKAIYTMAYELEQKLDEDYDEYVKHNI